MASSQIYKISSSEEARALGDIGVGSALDEVPEQYGGEAADRSWQVVEDGLNAGEEVGTT
jgi:hypothetical protein